MIALFCRCLALFASPFKSKSRLEAENAALRHQLMILRRKVRGRVRLTDGDRLFFIQLCDGFHQSSRPSQLSAPRWFCGRDRGCGGAPPRRDQPNGGSILRKYAYYNELRTHRSLGKKLRSLAIQHMGRIASEPVVKHHCLHTSCGSCR
jgi:hypothetical protein